MEATEPLRRTETGEAPHASLLFIGTATVLIRYGGFTILTDPNFLHRGEEARLGYGVRSARLTDPALEIDELPRLDLVVLSHLHGDHFDQVAQERLDRDLPIVTTRQGAVGLEQKGFRRARGLRRWQRLRVTKGDQELRITSLPGQHSPAPVGALLPQVMGSLLEFGPEASPSLRVYITGDTLIHRSLHEIPRRFPSIDLALVHLGGTRILGLKLTMDGADGVELLRIVRPGTAVPIHYDDYPVFRSPLEEFTREVKAAGLEDRVRYLRRGESVSLGEWREGR